MNRALTIYVALFLVITSSIFLCHGQTKVLPQAQEHFLRGKDLIENNCIDCNGGTEAGMIEGIKEIEAAIQAGYNDQIAAYKLLADGYNAMSTYTERNTSQSQAYSTKQAEVEHKLYELDPSNPQIALAYVDTLRADDKKAPVLREIVNRGPGQDSTYQDAAYELGLILLRGSDYHEGMSLVLDAIAREKDPEGINTFAQGLIGALAEKGCPLVDEQKLQQRLNESFGKAISGTGNPEDLSKFKIDFTNAVKEHACADK